MENFDTLSASVSGADGSEQVNLTWTNVVPGFPPIVAFGVQRKRFGRGDDDWTTLVSALTPVVVPVPPASGPGPAGLAPALGLASTFEVLAATTITNTGPTVVNGDLGMSPGSAVTGFPPGVITGSVQIGTTLATNAQTDLTTAYNNLTARGPGTVVGTTDLGGSTLTPGVYSSASTMLISSGDLILDGQGNPGAVFVFIVGSALTVVTPRKVVLINGAQAVNVFWAVGSSATIGVSSVLQGSILAVTSITLNTGATVVGRLLAQNGAVTLDSNPATLPVLAAPAPEGVAIPVPTPFAFTDSPAEGDWTYRLRAVLTQGGTNNLGTFIYSNSVNVTTEATTGEVTLTLSASPDGDLPAYTRVTLNWVIDGDAVDVRRYEVQRTLDRGATWKTVHQQDEFSSLSYAEVLPPALGDVFYRVIADLPSATPPYQTDVQSISNSVTVRT